MRKLVVLFVLCCASVTAYSKTPVKVLCSTEDAVGMRVCTAVRDQIAASPRYSLEEGKGAPTTFQIHLISVVDGTGNSTAFAAVYTIGTYYLTTIVETCGTAKVAECASDTIAGLDAKAHGQ